MRYAQLLAGAGLVLAVTLIAAGCGTTTASNAGHQTATAKSSKPASVASSPAAVSQPLGPAPAFSVTDTAGQTVTVPSAHATVLYFMAAWCGSCAAGEQQLAQLQRQLPVGVQMVSLDVTPQTDTPAALDQLASAAGAKWPQAFASNAVISAYKVAYLDTVAVVNPKGQLVYEGPIPAPGKLLSIVRSAAGTD